MRAKTQGSRGLKSGNQGGSSSIWIKETSEMEEEQDSVSNPVHLACLRHTGYLTLGNESNSRSHQLEASPNSNTASSGNIRKVSWAPSQTY